MQMKFTSILYFLALASSVAQACHHPKPSHDVSCSLSFKRGKLSSNGTHIIIQGTTTATTKCQKKRDGLAQSIAGGSVIHVFTKDTAHVKDAQGKTHHGNDCQVNVPEYTLPTVEKSTTTKLVLPLQKGVQIDCERRQHKSKQKPTKHHSPTPTTTKETSTHTTTTTTHTKSKPTTTKKKEPKPTHGSHDDDDDNDDKDWDYDHGTVTFFTPNQGACGEWNDDNDFIAALGEDLYGDMDEESKLCGKKILIEGPNGNDITVTVRDACPPCDASHIDLSPAAFAKLGKFDTGVLKVKWRFL